MFRRIDAVMVPLIVAVCILVNWSGLKAPDLWWTDESRHLMNGVFLHDVFVDRPLSGQYSYAVEYFARFPALALNWYLPTFPAILGLAMHIFGISEATAHWTVLFFWIVGLLAWYSWAARFHGAPIAALCTLLVVISPQMVLWSRSVMLEAPALAMVMVAVLATERYLESPGQRTAIIAALAISFALAIKQSTAFILPALFVYAWFSRRGGALFHRSALVVWILVSSTVLLLIAHAVLLGGVGVAATAGNLHELAGASASKWSIDRWTLHWRMLYEAIGPLPAILLFAGIVRCVFERRNNLAILAVAWLVSWYIFGTLLVGVPNNALRFSIYAIPATMGLVVYGATILHPASIYSRATIGVLLAWSIYQISGQFFRVHWYTDGYKQAASEVIGYPNSGSILFAGKFDGNFIFHLRAQDSERRHVVLRAEKLLVTMGVHKYFGTISHVNNVDDVNDMLDKNFVRWVVIESRDIVGLKEFQMLQEALKGERYSLKANIPVRTNVAEFSNLSILIYENKFLRLPQDGAVEIDYPYFGRAIRFNFPDGRVPIAAQ